MIFPQKCEHLLSFTHHVAAEDEDRSFRQTRPSSAILGQVEH